MDTHILCQTNHQPTQTSTVLFLLDWAPFHSHDHGHPTSLLILNAPLLGWAEGSIASQTLHNPPEQCAKDPQAHYHESEWTNYVPGEGERCSLEANNFCGGRVNFFFLPRRGEEALLAGKTLLPLDQRIDFGGAQIFPLYQAEAEPTEISVGLLLSKVKLNFT